MCNLIYTEGKKSQSKGLGNNKQWKRPKNGELSLKGKAYLGFAKNSKGKYEKSLKKIAAVSSTNIIDLGAIARRALG